MINPIVFVMLAALFAFPTLADPSPLTPAPGDTFKAGGDCTITWAADETGVWNATEINFMSGSDAIQNVLMLVTTIDCTNPNVTSFTWTCPEVNPYSAIYFYKFNTTNLYANGSAPDERWTTRFTITDPSGNSVPPPNQTQPDGAIPWGIGELVDPSAASSGASSSNVTGAPLVSPLTSNTTTNGTVSGNSSTTSSANSTAPSGSKVGANNSGAMRSSFGFAPVFIALTSIALTFMLIF